MALTTCPECNRANVSDLADACPGCGAPVRKLVAKKARENRVHKKLDKPPKASWPLCKSCQKDISRWSDGLCVPCHQRDVLRRGQQCRTCGKILAVTWTYCHRCFPGRGEPWKVHENERPKGCVFCEMIFSGPACPRCHPTESLRESENVMAGATEELEETAAWFDHMDAHSKGSDDKPN